MKNRLRTGMNEAAHGNGSFQENRVPFSKEKLHSTTPEQIRQRAFEIHKARGLGHGHALDDWLQAEREFLAEQEHPVGFGDLAVSGSWQNSR